jgi:hypothetical protein
LFAERAANVATLIQREDGTANACDELEGLYRAAGGKN